MKKLGFQFLNGYTKIGDNSGINLLPVLAGRTTEKMETTDKELIKDLPVNAEEIEFLWDLMKRKGCPTMINDDIMSSHRGLFAYHYNDGFKKPPVDYYLRPYSLYNVHKEVKPQQGQCTIHGQSLVNQHFELLERMSRVFKEHCHFSVSFLPTPTHDDPSRLETEDVEIRTMLEKFQATGILNNTAVVIMGKQFNHNNKNFIMIFKEIMVIELAASNIATQEELKKECPYFLYICLHTCMKSTHILEQILNTTLIGKTNF